jgi:hypothetical protein
MPISNKKPAITRSKLLIVEGRDEENFFEGGIAHLGASGVQVLGIGGKTQLTANLKVLRLDPNFASLDCIGIVRDADVTPPGSSVSASNSAFASVCSSLSASGVQLPLPPSHGQFAAGPPRVGIFIMPDGKLDGMLETLCAQSLAALSEFACVTDYFACLRAHGKVPGNMPKARAYAWLASCADPGKRVGEAALARYWPFNDLAFAEIWAFVRAM